MNRTRKLILLLLVFVLLIGGAAILYNLLQNAKPTQQLVSLKEDEKTAGTGEVTEGKTDAGKAPDFTVYDADGNAVRLSDYFGKPIVLNFWASWCVPCQSEMPDFQESYLQLGDEVQFLMVNMTNGRETLGSAKSFIAKSGYTFPVLYDTDAHAAAVYGVYSLPTTYFIDARGNPVAYATGAISAQLLQQGIDMIKE